MPRIALQAGLDGKLAGLTDADQRKYDRFRGKVRTMTAGDSIAFEYRVPRSPKFHRRHFLILGTVFDNQEAFVDDYQFRKWTEVGAGHFDMVPGPSGALFPLARSINYESLDDHEFSAVHDGVIAFLRSLEATRHLWPQVSDRVGLVAMDNILMEFNA